MALLFVCICSVACGESQPPPKAPTEAEPAPASASPAEGAGLTAAACEASGGSVVGDIGDGAIHRPDYRCASGAKPSGSIRAAEGGPIGVEGSVCCPR
jgi:hypothetical protein